MWLSAWAAAAVVLGSATAVTFVAPSISQCAMHPLLSLSLGMCSVPYVPPRTSSECRKARAESRKSLNTKQRVIIWYWIAVSAAITRYHCHSTFHDQHSAHTRHANRRLRYRPRLIVERVCAF